MTDKFTPGPWAWGGKPGKSELSAAGGNKVLDYAGYEGLWFAACDEERDAANACLIAAAPDLLAELRECRAIMDSLRDFVAEGGSRSMVGALQVIREAGYAMEVSGQVIARAEGRP